MHQTLNGEYVDNVLENPFQIPDNYYEGHRSVYGHILKIDSHMPFVSERIPALAEYINPERAQTEADIEKLLDTLTGANATLISYANGKIEELDAKRQSLIKAIADMSAGAVSTDQIKRISGYLNNWGNVAFDDRRLVVDGLISTIRATSEDVSVEWKF